MIGKPHPRTCPCSRCDYEREFLRIVDDTRAKIAAAFEDIPKIRARLRLDVARSALDAPLEPRHPADDWTGPRAHGWPRANRGRS